MTLKPQITHAQFLLESYKPFYFSDHWLAEQFW